MMKKEMVDPAYVLMATPAVSPCHQPEQLLPGIHVARVCPTYFC